MGSLKSQITSIKFQTNLKLQIRMTQTISIFPILMKLSFSIHFKMSFLQKLRSVCYLGFWSLVFVCYLRFVIWNFSTTR